MGNNIEILVLNGRQGGNPGSMCDVVGHPKVNRGYLKYAPGSKIVKDMPFNANHQPFYESIANHFVGKAGLSVPKTFIVYNDERIDFNNVDPSSNKENIGKGDRFYFLSKEVEVAKYGSKEEGDKGWKGEIDNDKPYLNVFGIEDVIDRRDNSFYSEGESPHNIYFDLGCGLGFMANEGSLEIKNKPGKNIGTKRNDFKKMEKRLKKWNLVSKDQRKLNFYDLVEEIPEIRFNYLNSGKEEKICDFLSPEEIKAIQEMTGEIFQNAIKKYKNTGYIEKI